MIRTPVQGVGELGHGGPTLPLGPAGGEQRQPQEAEGNSACSYKKKKKAARVLLNSG